MKDCAGGQHPDNEPVTWWQFDREMAHRDRLAAQKEEIAQREIDRRATEVAELTEKRTNANRWLIVVITFLSFLAQIWFRR